MRPYLAKMCTKLLGNGQNHRSHVSGLICDTDFMSGLEIKLLLMNYFDNMFDEIR